MRSVRAFAFNAYFVSITVLLGLGGFGVRAFARDRALGLARLWVRATLAGLRVIGGVRIEVSGRENLPAGPAVIASQHRSAFDTLVWLTLVPRPSYVMKQELRRIPLVGPLLEPAGMIPIDRAGGAAALRFLLRAADAALGDGRQIVIFPEGTRVRPGEQVRLAPGIAAIAGRRGAPTIPVATDSGVAWGHGALMRPAARSRRVIRIAIGSALPPHDDRAGLLAAIIRSWDELERRMGEPGQARPVDNSVESAIAHMRSDASERAQVPRLARFPQRGRSLRRTLRLARANPAD